MLHQRIDALGMGLAHLVQELRQTHVALDNGIQNIIDVVGQELARTTRNQIQITADLLEQLGLYVVMLQELDTNGYGLLRQARVQIVQQNAAENVRDNIGVRGIGRVDILGAGLTVSIIVILTVRAQTEALSIRHAARAVVQIVLEAYLEQLEQVLVIVDNQLCLPTIFNYIT
jgi:hypothetical protein